MSADTPQPSRALRAALLLTLAVAAILFSLHGSRFVATNDEGILLEPAQRLAEGQRPYVDFFGYMSPGSYWIQAAVFRLFGVSLLSARIPVILGFALQCGLVLWFAARLASFRAALITALLFFGFQIADPTFLTAQHRWDSSTLALLGLACAAASRRGGRLAMPLAMPVACGVALGLAAWCTPSMGLVILAALAWFAWLRDHRGVAAAVGGVAAVSGLAVALLAAQGSLAAFAAQMLWLKQNYSTVNIMPYGSVIGGYGRLFADVSGAALAFTALFVVFLALPAILPPLAPLAWWAEHRHRALPREEAALLALFLPATAALVVTAFPRADLMHLAFVAALPAALCGAALSRLLPARAIGFTTVLLALGALAFASNHARGYAQSVRLHSPAGGLLADHDKAGALRQILARVRPGDSLLVHPYMPVLYFATQARNVSRFSFLAPGMMTAAEERELLASLSAAPPAWVLYQPITREEFLRVFPNATNLDNAFPSIDRFLAEHYEPAERHAISYAGYRLLRRKTPFTNSVLQNP